MFPAEAQIWIDKLQLESHVEGGWYREVYRSPLQVAAEVVAGSFTGPRSIVTHIYFLLTTGVFSAFHRITSDELWHFYAGDPISIYGIDPEGRITEHILGNTDAHLPFTWIKAGHWFASRVHGNGRYALVGCTVSPGFDFDDFELAKADELSLAFPQHEVLIRSLCRV